MEVLSFDDNLLPDWFSEGSVPAKAISLLGLSKLFISGVYKKTLLCAILIFIEFSYVNILIISSTFYFNLSADNLLGAK